MLSHVLFMRLPAVYSTMPPAAAVAAAEICTMRLSRTLLVEICTFCLLCSAEMPGHLCALLLLCCNGMQSFIYFILTASKQHTLRHTLAMTASA